MQSIGRAVLVDVTWPSNFYHNLAEHLFEYYHKMCWYLKECSGPSDTWLLMLPVQQSAKASLNWSQEASHMRGFLDCLSTHPALNVRHPSLTSQVCPALVRQPQLYTELRLQQTERERVWHALCSCAV